MSVLSQLNNICDLLYNINETLEPINGEIKEKIIDRLVFRFQEIFEFTQWYNKLSADSKDDFEILLGNVVYKNVLIDISVHGEIDKDQLINQTISEYNLVDHGNSEYEMDGILDIQLDMMVDEDLIDEIKSMMVDDVIGEIKNEFNPFEEFLSSLDEYTLEVVYHQIIDVGYGTFCEHLGISREYMTAIMQLSTETV